MIICCSGVVCYQVYEKDITKCFVKKEFEVFNGS